MISFRPFVYFCALVLAPGNILAEAPSPPTAHSTVVWISIDGMRGDYVNRPDLSFFGRMLKEGAFTRQMEPVFPSLTFPNHVSQATGVPVSQHGIILNNIYVDGKDIHYPAEARFLEAEPIWITAERQNVRSLVFDWPLSQQQTGPVTAAYFHEKFSASPSDQERLQELLATWKADTNPRPLRLLMGYVSKIDSEGHKNGPDSPEVNGALKTLDGQLSDFLTRALEMWKQSAGPGDQFYLVLTTDHGMDTVTNIVNPKLLIGAALIRGAKIVSSGCVANIFLDGLPSETRATRADTILDALRQYSFIQGYRRAELPEKWAYNDPRRTGDIVLVLNPGYTFNNGAKEIAASLAPGDGPRGMHGYPAEVDSKMLGFACIWRSPDLLGGVDLGPVSALQFHPTIAAALGISSAPAASAKPLDLSVGAKAVLLPAVKALSSPKPPAS